MNTVVTGWGVNISTTNDDQLATISTILQASIEQGVLNLIDF